MDTISKRIDNITEIRKEYRGVVLPAPPSVKIELTSRCNFGCHFCAHGNGKGGERGDMDFDLFKRLASEMRMSGVEELGMFYIGESLLYPKLADAIRFAKHECGYPYVFLTTNGSLADPDKLAEVMQAGLDSLKWSLNSADIWQFRQITNMAPSVFMRTLKNVEEAWNIRQKGEYKTRLYASSIKYDGVQGHKMQKLIDKIRPFVDEHYWLPLLSFGDTADRIREKGFKTVVGNPGRADTMRPPLPCWAVFKEGHITKDGFLSACCFDASDSWIMADLKEVSFMDGWNSEKFKALRQAHLNEEVHDTPCSGCIYGVNDDKRENKN